MYKKVMLSFAFATLVCCSNVQAQNEKETSMNMETSSNWTVISNQNGMNVMLSEKVIGNHKYLYLKFENTTVSEKKFSWKLYDVKGSVTGSELVVLSPVSSLSGYDDATINGGNMNLLIDKTQSVKDFSVQVTTIQ